MIEEIDAVTGGPSKLRTTSLLILGATIFILVMFAFFGTGSSPLHYTGSVTGPSISVEDTVNQADFEVQSQVSTLSEEGKYKLVLNILKLKDLNKETTKLQFAERVSNIADYIDALSNRQVQETWESMFGCLEEGCGEQFYVLLDVVLDNAFVESESQKSFLNSLFADEPLYSFMPKLLSNVVNLGRAVDKEDIVESSRAMIAVNSLISKVDSTEINDIWNELVKCDLECPYYDELTVKLVEFKLNSMKE